MEACLRTTEKIKKDLLLFLHGLNPLNNARHPPHAREPCVSPPYFACTNLRFPNQEQTTTCQKQSAHLEPPTRLSGRADRAPLRGRRSDTRICIGAVALAGGAQGPDSDCHSEPARVQDGSVRRGMNSVPCWKTKSADK